MKDGETSSVYILLLYEFCPYTHIYTYPKFLFLRSGTAFIVEEVKNIKAYVDCSCLYHCYDIP